MYSPVNFETYQKQANDLAAQINQLQKLQQTGYPGSLTPFQPQIPPHIDYVQGMDGAKEYLKNMPANGQAVLMDKDDAVFYVVSKDANSNAAPIAFARFTLETEQAPEMPEHVTKRDFETFKAELKTMLKGEQA